MSDHGRGFVCIHREIMDHWVWQDKPVSKGQAWVDLILLANYRSEKFSYKDGVVEGKRGCVYRSISFLAERWGWSRDKASRFLHQLESDGMIRLFATTHHTTITLVNDEIYQGIGATDTATDRQQTVSKSAHTTKLTKETTVTKGTIPKVQVRCSQRRRSRRRAVGLIVSRR